MDVFYGNLEAVKASGFRRCDFGCKVATEVFVDDAIGGREEGKNMQDEVLFCCQESVPVSQSTASLERSISSAVQKEASAFLYILQMLLCWMGKRTKR